MSHSDLVNVRFFQPPPDMRRYFTTFYLVELDVAPDVRLTDYLHPEWANLRLCSGATPEAQTANGTTLSGSHFAVTGPSSKAVRFDTGAARVWGIGILPLGWARFLDAPAAELANVAVDGFAHPAFSGFRSLARDLFGPEPDTEAELDRIIRFFASYPQRRFDDEERITAIHDALIDSDVCTVAELVERSNCSQRTVERECLRAFGFAPKLLLRRQRFMRSLSQFMLDPSLKWIGAIDSQYHDQAQFVRDFREFMGMTPRAYAKLDKPILNAIMRERARIAGAAVQTLDGPSGVGFASQQILPSSAAA